MPLGVAMVFVVFVAVAVLSGKLPVVVVGLYLVASSVTFAVYAYDKAAARRQRWRTREATLHMLAVAGGWPGAVIAQRVLHHKSKKQSFQVVFWFTALVNCAVLFVLGYKW